MAKHDGQQQDNTLPSPLDQEPDGQERREFLRSLGKWSQAVIGGVLTGGALITAQPAEAWYNRGGGWYDRPGGGWYNRRPGGWYNRRPGGWYNRRPGGGWYNRGGGGGWYNRGGGGGWYDRPGGGWYNRRPGGWYNR